MTISKKVRAYLAKRPNASAKEILAKFNTSPAMAYRLVKEARDNEARNEKLRSDIVQALTNTPANITPLEITIQDDIVIQENTPDPVNSPSHYTIGGIETIDFIEAKGLHQHYHLANAIKYISRAPYKNNYTEDLKKAVWYLQRELQRQQLPLT